MASKAFLVALQYGMLLCICGYIFVTVKSMFKDLKSTSSLKPVKEESAQNEVALIVLEAADPKLANKKISFSGQISIGRGKENDIVLEIFMYHIIMLLLVQFAIFIRLRIYKVEITPI